MRLTPRTLLLLGIGDPALVVGLLSLTGLVHVPTAAAAVLTAIGVALNAMAIIEIVRNAPRGEE